MNIKFGGKKMGENHNLKNRKKPTDHRQGNLIKIIDLIQRFEEIQHEKDFWQFEEQYDDGHINPKYLDELQDMMRELRLFDITEIGNLYLTSGGRIVLDKGWGEYFGEGDTVIFTLEELISGMPYDKFIKKLHKLK
jgi:hypothetical protein